MEEIRHCRIEGAALLELDFRISSSLVVSGEILNCRQPKTIPNGHMVFTKRLREGVRRGFITCSIRIWKNPHVKVGGRYRMDEGEIVIDSVELISLQDVTHDLAVESGFESRADLLSVAKHGSGNNVYLIRFHYIPSTSLH